MFPLKIVLGQGVSGAHAWASDASGPTHNRFPGLNNFDLGMRFTKEGVYRPFLLYADLSVL